MRGAIRGLLAAFLFGGIAAEAAEVDGTVVVVMVDGLPARLLETAETPNFDRLLAQSAWSDGLIPAFPSVSHTNWTSLTTGCWPEHHGIVSNVFQIDGERGTREQILDADTLLDCQPIHAAAEAQGVKAAALGWTSSSSSRHGELASIVMPYFDSWTAENDIERAKQVGGLLALPEAQRPRLVLAYFSGPDVAQHYNGMNSSAARRAVEHSDRAIGELLDHLEAFAKTERVTLLVVTDHGMLDISGLLNVEKLLAESGVEASWIADGPLAFVYLKDREARAAAIEALSGSGPFAVIRPEDQPEHWRLGQSDRLGDFMLYAKPGWFFPTDQDMPDWLPTYSRWWPTTLQLPLWLRSIGMHGYAYEDVPEMAGLFVAWGSGISKTGPLGLEIRAVDLHPTVARLLGIQPGVPQDGRVLEELLVLPE